MKWKQQTAKQKKNLPHNIHCIFNSIFFYFIFFSVVFLFSFALFAHLSIILLRFFFFCSLFDLNEYHIINMILLFVSMACVAHCLITSIRFFCFFIQPILRGFYHHLLNTEYSSFSQLHWLETSSFKWCLFINYLNGKKKINNRLNIVYIYHI